MIEWIRGAWKAVMAVATPLVVAAVDSAWVELQAAALGIVTAVITAIMVYAVPNRS